MVGDFRHFARPVWQIGSAETKLIARKAAVSGPVAHFVGTKPNVGMAGWGGRIRTSIWRTENRVLSPVREEPQNLLPLKLIGNSKRWNFENRTESAESGALEINGPFGE